MFGRWKEYRDGSGPTSVAWADDGPLANPALFGGYWVPWRDELGQPLATYRHPPIPYSFSEVVLIELYRTNFYASFLLL